MAGKYTFDTYVIDENNRTASLACMSLSQNSKKNYNPLYIWGKHGVGKTHLLYAIQNAYQQNGNKMNVIYVEGDWFVKEVVNGIRYKSMNQLRNKYRTTDILLVDNIQNIIGKKSSQEEFFHTFDCLLETGKQIVITADKPPKDFSRINEKLKSRLLCGLTTDIGKQGNDTKSKVVSTIAKRNQLLINDDVCKYVALKYGNELAEVNKIFANIKHITAIVTKEIIDVEMESIIGEGKKAISTKVIIRNVAKYYGVTESQIMSQSRSKVILNTRQIAMYLCKEMTEENPSSLGTVFKKDRITVKNGIEKISVLMKEDISLTNEVNCLKKQIGESDL